MWILGLIGLIMIYSLLLSTICSSILLRTCHYGFMCLRAIVKTATARCSSKMGSSCCTFFTDVNPLASRTTVSTSDILKPLARLILSKHVFPEPWSVGQNSMRSSLSLAFSSMLRTLLGPVVSSFFDGGVLSCCVVPCISKVCAAKASTQSLLTMFLVKITTKVLRSFPDGGFVTKVRQNISRFTCLT